MRHRRSGPYQVQAAIAALHARAAKPEDTDWAQIDLLYGALEVMQPSPVVTLNRSVAVSKARGPEAALEMIEPLAERLSNYFHYFGVRGAYLMQLGRNEEARVAFDRAIALANTSAEAAHIRMHLDRLMRDSQSPRQKIFEKIFLPMSDRACSHSSNEQHHSWSKPCRPLSTPRRDRLPRSGSTVSSTASPSCSRSSARFCSGFIWD